jgi:hypothetical protein
MMMMGSGIPITKSSSERTGRLLELSCGKQTLLEVKGSGNKSASGLPPTLEGIAD